MRLRFLLISLPLFITSCTCNKPGPEGGSEGSDANVHGQTGGTEPGSSGGKPTSPADPRDGWMATETVFEVVGGVKGRTIVDLFAGDGYYAFKLVDAGANVIAIDTDPTKLAAIEELRKSRGIPEERLRTRLTKAGEPGLLPREADMAFCVHRYTTLGDRARFFANVRSGLKSPAPVIIIEFLMTQTPVGPPLEQRINENQLMDELDPAGFSDIGVYTQKIPYQYIAIAQDFVPGPGSADDAVVTP
ncbi:MAG: class I SAM-dependent methyltransferase [Flavobacteriales bacterium]|nr:class I SAM-dependent methyltransferase [Flavobacteriales bacterium]